MRQLTQFFGHAPHALYVTASDDPQVSNMCFACAFRPGHGGSRNKTTELGEGQSEQARAPKHVPSSTHRRDHKTRRHYYRTRACQRKRQQRQEIPQVFPTAKPTLRRYRHTHGSHIQPSASRVTCVVGDVTPELTLPLLLSVRRFRLHLRVRLSSF